MNFKRFGSTLIQKTNRPLQQQGCPKKTIKLLCEHGGHILSMLVTFPKQPVPVGCRGDRPAPTAGTQPLSKKVLGPALQLETLTVQGCTKIYHITSP